MPSKGQAIQASCILGAIVLSGCVRTPLPPDSPALSCPEPSIARSTISQDQATIQPDTDKNLSTTIQALQKRLFERERTLAVRDQQIEILSSQLDALKQIDQDTRARKRLGRFGSSSMAVRP